MGNGRIFQIICVLSIGLALINTPAQGETPQDLDLSPEVIQNSPVLRRWREEIPNVLEEIKHDPSFVTRLRVGYSQFPSTGQVGGVYVGVEDLLIGRTGLTVSGEYQSAFNGEREVYGADVRYYLRPLGSYVNFAPVLGYRYLETSRYTTEGVNVGVKLLLVLSRGGAADIGLSQSWVAPGTRDEVGLTTLSVGYAVTRHFRVAGDIQQQNTRLSQDSRVGVVLEWIP